MTGARAEYAAWHDRLGADAGDDPWHRLVLAHLDPARDLAGRRVLEIGCGRGGFARRLTASGVAAPALYLAADFAPRALAIARAAGGLRPEGSREPAWAAMDVAALALPAAAFDTAISCETVEHLPDPAAAIAELARALAPGGRLFLTTPNYFGPMGLYRAYLRLAGRPYTEEGQPINRFTWLPRTLAWVRRAGLAVETVAGAGHYRLWPGRSPERLAALDRWPGQTAFALHSLVVATRPAGGPPPRRRSPPP